MIPTSDVNAKGKVSVGINLEGRKDPCCNWC